MAVLQLKAVALALKKYPDFNGFYLERRASRPAPAVHIGRGDFAAPGRPDRAGDPRRRREKRWTS